MKKLLFTLVLSFTGLLSFGQNVLIERVLYAAPNEINILSIDRQGAKVFFSNSDRPGLLYSDLRVNKVILDSTLSNVEFMGFTKLDPVYSLLQLPDKSFYLSNSINGELTPIVSKVGNVALPELQYDDSRDVYYGVEDNNIIECRINDTGILSVDTVTAFKGINLHSIHSFNGDQFYSIEESDNIKYIAKNTQGSIQKLRYPINYGESANEIAVLNSDSIIVSRRLRLGEHQLALIYATEIVSQIDSIEVRKIKEVQTTQIDSVIDQTYIPFNEFTAERNRDIGKGRWATVIEQTTDALKAMVSLNNALAVNPRSFSYKDDSVYFVLGPKREVKFEAEQDSVFYSRKGIVTRTFDFEYDTLVKPADVVLRLKCIDRLSGLMPGFKVDFYEYESNTVVNSTNVLPEEVCYLSYFPDYTLGITVTSPGYLPHSLKVDPSLEYKTSRQTEKIVFLDNATGQTVRAVTNDMSTVPPKMGDGGAIASKPNNNSTKSRPVILKNVFFSFDSNELSEVAMRELELVYESQKNAKSLSIIGHTDSKGSDSYNQGLSERRAAEVANFMRELGFKGKLNSIGKGESTPIATNETAAGRSKNRRVEIVVTY